MEKEAKNGVRTLGGAPEANFLLQLGNRKRSRCVKARLAAGGTPPSRSDSQRRSALRAILRFPVVECDWGETPMVFSRRRSESAGSESAKLRSASASLDKEDRFYPTRGSVAAVVDENGGGGGSEGGEDRVGPVVAVATLLPRFFISLSNKEMEEDFLAMKGCKLPQRPKKRPKILQKSLLLNEERQLVDLYIPRKWLIAAKDHAVVQINIGHLDEHVVYTRDFTTFALSGFIRAQENVPALAMEEVLLSLFRDYDIPSEWKVLPVFAAVHLDPELYTEPQKFAP